MKIKNCYFFLLLFCFYFSNSSAQKKNIIQITGKVYIDNEPIENAAVYLNSTMVGTTTDANGEFKLPVDEGEYQLIVSFLGYKNITYNLKTSTYKNPLIFSLELETKSLDEIIITSKNGKKSKLSRNKRNRYFTKFRETFIGTTKFSKKCKILNPEVLKFNYNKTTKELTVNATEPLKIRNESLGYLITYNLEYFRLSPTQIAYLGFSKYTEMKSKKEKEIKQWSQNRLRSYLGSKQHFFKSLINKDYRREKYKIALVQKIKNPERATNEEIKKANNYITQQKMKNVFVDFSKEIDYPSNKLDSAIIAVNSSKLPLFTYKIINKYIKQKEFFNKINNDYFLSFQHELRVKFMAEEEEKNYPRNGPKLKHQESYIRLLKNQVKVNANGTLEKPFNVFVTGYWSFEQFADDLPTDYIPNFDKN
ncbi:carboxypeptidase-like regulatory domain-containing protein [Polaribacter dokdonensis]|uniref:CarboxypepD_reg-like domain-containing protein n=1 Tax=Polaribacter dokdonensis DSW-5 TaxID=1300348 RepID=A0A0M9CG06_9FLAO|nr:carboxypeptidase-like regulatory domain-containing protein [Polaribacter dokdonensis]KOY51399.1 hypothetical protein I602_959 [Polaribacter dokdonensis DSW-5]SEE12221.1 CarboxypepD_reg-like domain-containing protein [Polaribacter dokdonensis DSW-5]